MPDATTYTTKLQHTTALIIGGTSGLGFGVACALVEHGARHVIVSSSNRSRVDDAVRRIGALYPDRLASGGGDGGRGGGGEGGAKVSGVVCDLGTTETLESQVKALLEEVRRLLGLNEGEKGLDHVVHTAGDRLLELPVAEWSVEAAVKAGNVRFFAPLMVAKHARGVLKERGSITLTTGGVADHPIPGWTIVAGYAAGLAGMTRNLALDLKPIRVNLISPGGVETEMWDQRGQETKEVVMKSVAKKVRSTIVTGLNKRLISMNQSTTGRIGQVEDVVETYLCAMKDQNMSGSVLRTDSGHSLM